MARAHLTAHRYDEAIAWARKAVPCPRVILATRLGHAGELESARAELAECKPGYTARADNWHSYNFPEDQEHFLDGLRKAGWTG